MEGSDEQQRSVYAASNIADKCHADTDHAEQDAGAQQVGDTQREPDVRSQ